MFKSEFPVEAIVIFVKSIKKGIEWYVHFKRKPVILFAINLPKGNSFVVMNTTDYDNKILSHLKDIITYKTITHDSTDQFVNSFINELKQLK